MSPGYSSFAVEYLERTFNDHSRNQSTRPPSKCSRRTTFEAEQIRIIFKPSKTMTYNTIIPNYNSPLRVSKRQREPAKVTAPKPALPRPEAVRRSASLPSKLEEAPPTKKLFWFRPSAMLDTQRERSDTSSTLPSTSSFDDEASATAYLAAEDPDGLFGLDFIEDV